MATVLTTRLPPELDKELLQVAKAEHLDKSTVVRRLLSSAVSDWKQEHALKMYSSGKFSAEQASTFAALSLWQFFDLLKAKKIPINYDTEELEKDLITIKWKK